MSIVCYGSSDITIHCIRTWKLDCGGAKVSSFDFVMFEKNYPQNWELRRNAGFRQKTVKLYGQNSQRTVKTLAYGAGPQSRSFAQNNTAPCLIFLSYVLSAQTIARQSDIQAFSFDLRLCEHVLLQQQHLDPLSHTASSARLTHCAHCALTSNLWLCLECRNVACGRYQFGGEGLTGNGPTVQHYTDIQHPVSIKLGSISAEGKADVYCYEQDEEIVDPELARYLGNWVIKLVVPPTAPSTPNSHPGTFSGGRCGVDGG